jgi:hypothetical protein
MFECLIANSLTNPHTIFFLFIYVHNVLFFVVEKLTLEKLDVPEVTQSEEGQKQKLDIVLGAANRVNSIIYGYIHKGLVFFLQFDKCITF